MYPSVRDHIVLAAWPTLKQGLDALGFASVELEFARDRSVFAINPTEDKPRFVLETEDDIKNFRRHLEVNGVAVSALLMSNNFGNPDLQAEIDWTVAAIRAAEALDIPAVRIDAIMHGEHDLPIERNVSVFADAMMRILEATSDSKVDMGVENHGFQGNQPEFLDMLLSKVNSPRVGVTIDTGNFYWWGHPLSKVYDIIEHFAAHCKHTHAKNIQFPPEKREVQREVGWEYGTYVSPLPDGDIDHRRVVQILKAAGYDRDLCLENEAIGKWEGDERRAVLIRDADFFRSIL